MNGFLLINKPQGLTSFDVIRDLRKKLNTKKIGHAGTLDPMATGLLLVAVGEGTKLLEYLIKQEKTYLAEITFGAVSDTYDAEGRITRTDFNGEVSQTQLQKILTEKLSGKIQQIPPKFSALKINGQKACDLARAGQEVEMKKREVEIKDLGVLDFFYPKLNLKIDCGTGTYIRSIAHDLGQFLGCGGYLSKLERTRIGVYFLTDAIDLNAVKVENLLPLEWGIKGLKQFKINLAETQELHQGKQIDCDILFEDQAVLFCLCEGKLVSICQYLATTKKLQPVKNINAK